MQITPLTGALGAQVDGVSLSALDDAGWRTLHRAFLDYQVLAIRGQQLEPADLMQVGGRFYAVETPAYGGDTLFTNTYAPSGGLAEGMGEMRDPLVGVNSAALKYGGGRSTMHKQIAGM